MKVEEAEVVVVHLLLVVGEGQACLGLGHATPTSLEGDCQQMKMEETEVEMELVVGAGKV